MVHSDFIAKCLPTTVFHHKFVRCEYFCTQKQNKKKKQKQKQIKTKTNKQTKKNKKTLRLQIRGDKIWMHHY